MKNEKKTDLTILNFDNNEAQESMDFTINIVPLSVNEAWQGRRYKTDRYKLYEKELLYRLPAKELPKPPYKVHFEFGINPLMDWDNPIKPLQDILQKKYGFNDRDVLMAVVEKKPVKREQEYINATISAF